jgi:hypothetical protein
MTTMAVLVNARTAASLLGVSTQSIARMRLRGALKPTRKHPFMFRLADVEALRVARQSRKHRQPCGVEIVAEER